MAKISVMVLCACIVAMGVCASASAYVGAKGTFDAYSTGACIQGSCPPQGYMGGPPPAMHPQYGAAMPQYGAAMPQYGAPMPQYGAPPPHPRRITKCKPPMGACPQGPVVCPPPGCAPPGCGPASYAVPACGPMGCPPSYKRPVRWY
jgi:hypothetical protein